LLHWQLVIDFALLALREFEDTTSVWTLWKKHSFKQVDSTFMEKLMCIVLFNWKTFCPNKHNKAKQQF